MAEAAESQDQQNDDEERHGRFPKMHGGDALAGRGFTARVISYCIVARLLARPGLLSAEGVDDLGAGARLHRHRRGRE
jgi:hypothetical protein